MSIILTVTLPKKLDLNILNHIIQSDSGVTGKLIKYDPTTGEGLVEAEDSILDLLNKPIGISSKEPNKLMFLKQQIDALTEVERQELLKHYKA